MNFTAINYLYGSLCVVGRGLAPAVSLIIKGFHGRSKPPPYIVDRSISPNLSKFSHMLLEKIVIDSDVFKLGPFFLGHRHRIKIINLCPAH